METMVLIFHPNIMESTANIRLGEKAATLKNMTIRYMYQEYPTFNIDIIKEQQYLEKVDRIIWQFPFYWYSSPALLKQYQDLVLTADWAYGDGEEVLYGKELLLAVTVGSKEEKYTHEKGNLYTMNELLRPFQTTSRIIGTKYLEPFIVYGTAYLDEIELEDEAVRYANYLSRENLNELKSNNS